MCCICECCVSIIGTILKICIYLFNVFFWVAGCALLGYGIYLATEKVQSEYAILFDDLATSIWDATVALIIVMGILIVSAGILGCCGSCKDSRMLWFAYICFMGIILALQITASALAATQQSDLKKYMDDNFQDQIKHQYGAEGHGEVTDAWDALQEDFKCCGAWNYTDYQNSNFTNSQQEMTTALPGGMTLPPGAIKQPVPDSCCVLDITGAYVDRRRCMIQATIQDPHLHFLHDKGCISEVESSIDETAAAIYGTMLIVAIFVCCSMVMGFCKCCGVDKEDSAV